MWNSRPNLWKTVASSPVTRRRRPKFGEGDNVCAQAFDGLGYPVNAASSAGPDIPGDDAHDMATRQPQDYLGSAVSNSIATITPLATQFR